MTFKSSLVCERKHLIIYSRRITHTKHRNASIHKLLAYPVNSHIRLSTNKHLTLSSESLIYSLYQSSCLTCSRRTMNHHHIFCPQHLINGFLLSLVEPREMHRLELEMLCRLMRIEEVTEICQTIASGMHNTLKGIKHKAVRGFVERERDK